MKIHRPIINAAEQALKEIFLNKEHADAVIKKTLKSDSRWGSRDRKFLAEVIYEVVRWYRRFETFSQNSNEEHKFLNLIGVYLSLKGIDFPDWFKEYEISPNYLEEKSSEIQSIRKIRDSYPDWMDDLLIKELGEEAWDTEATALNIPAATYLRTNTLKSSVDDLRDNLSGKEIELSEIGIENAFQLVQKRNITHLKEYQNGDFEIQDANSQLIAPFLNPQKGELIIDACAGGGGKSLHLAALLNNTGRIEAFDIHGWKLKNLRARATRAGAKNIFTHTINESTIKKFKGKADRLLLDVPCTGMGVLKRNPGDKWMLSPQKVDDLVILQEKILSEYVSMLKPGGTLVYATCSILPSENQNQIANFLKMNSENYSLEEEKQVLPSSGSDGFYMARLRKS